MRHRHVFPSLLLSLFLLPAFAFAAETPKARRAPTCADLRWSEAVTAQYPDIGAICQAVYVRDGVFYARATIEITSARAGRLSFRTLHTDGSKGRTQSVSVGTDWRASIDGKAVRAAELLPGQKLNVYVPEDRFAIAFGAGAPVAVESARPE